MSEEQGSKPNSDSGESDNGPISVGPPSDAMRSLLKRALAEPPVEAKQEREILDGVQRKIRKRSRGKFYGDGWSTSQSRISYALVCALMLAVIALAYAAMTPSTLPVHP
jgi:hypothetical protein